MSQGPGKFIPVPEVSEYTDSVVVGDLGLPVGLDIERIGLNVHGLERAAKFGSIGHVTITGFRGDVTEQSFSTGSVNPDGTSSVISTRTISKAKLHDMELDGSDTGWADLSSADYVWRDASLKINNAEVEERIRKDGARWNLGLYDPAARTKYMDVAIRRGIKAAAIESVNNDNRLVALGMNATLFVMSAARGESVAGALGLQVATSAIFRGMVHFAEKMNSPTRELPPLKKSLLYGIYYDRLAASLALAQTTRFVRVLPGTKEN